MNGAVSGKKPYDAKNAMNNTLGLLLIESQIDAFMLLAMLMSLYGTVGDGRPCSDVLVFWGLGTLQSCCYCRNESHSEETSDTCIYIAAKVCRRKPLQNAAAPSRTMTHPSAPE
jgi:hypothetical protein